MLTVLKVLDLFVGLACVYTYKARNGKSLEADTMRVGISTHTYTGDRSTLDSLESTAWPLYPETQ